MKLAELVERALAFLARGYGLDTCQQEAWARLRDAVGAYLRLPPKRSRPE